jgi:hypothetical protein
MNKYIITIKHRKRIRRGSIYAEVLRATLDLPTDEIAIKVAKKLHESTPMAPTKTNFNIKGYVCVMILDEENGIVLNGNECVWKDGERVVGGKNMYSKVWSGNIV